MSISCQEAFNQHTEVELVPVDYSKAYADIAPLVTGAAAYLEHGHIEDAGECLRQACEIIRIVRENQYLVRES